MIKGKFYSGLPSEMMTRSRAVDRQQTNFFWPDETDAESVSESPRKRNITRSTTITTNNNNNNVDTTQSDIKPKELFRKQLSSGIQFYDNVNAKTPESRRRRFKKIDNINLNNNVMDFQPEKKKLETFSSKIEFYDFEPDLKTKKNAKNDMNIEKHEKSVKTTNLPDVRNDDIKTKNDSPEVSKKRISFRTMEKTKSILKNSDEKPLVEKVMVKPLPKRGLLPKNMSKSVENISKLAKHFDDDDIPEKKSETLSTIIKEVKNLNLTNEGTRKMAHDYGQDEKDSYYRGPDRVEPRRSNVSRDYDRDYGRKYPDKYDSRGYRESEYRYRSEEKSHNEPYRYNKRYDDDYDDRGDRNVVDRRYERSQNITHSQRRDSYDYRDVPHRYEESPIRGRRSPNYDRYDYDRDYEPEPRPVKNAPLRDAKPPPLRDVPRKPIDSYYDEPPKRNIRYEEDEYSTCISRKPAHTPQHLRSNILFNGRVRPQNQRPLSVRNSAVTRVGVGLPDIE